MPVADRLLYLCLGGLAFSLLLVGVVSATPLRHLVQAAPAILAFVFAWRGTGWSAYAALPIFLFWLFITSLIWLFLLGVAEIVTGTFSPAERLLTLTIDLSCVLGIIAALRSPRTSTWQKRAVVFLAFGLLAVAAMWGSLQPWLAQR